VFNNKESLIYTLTYCRCAVCIVMAPTGWMSGQLKWLSTITRAVQKSHVLLVVSPLCLWGNTKVVGETFPPPLQAWLVCIIWWSLFFKQRTCAVVW